MCGIVGVFDYRDQGHSIDRQVFDRMVDSLAHRGPNGRGAWHGTGIALGHRRLSVLDPTAAGAQPMHDARGSCVVTYNGEIYNFRELQAELKERGHVFKTNCDTEVLLASYAEWGTAAVSRFNGIFAFGLWDATRRRLWLVRDRLGVKPLSYSLQGGVLRFASEIKAILADPEFLRNPSSAGINAFLSFGFIPAPLTGFDEIAQVEPAQELIFENGKITQRRYWALSMREQPCSREEADEEFAARFQAAVSRQMVSDVPIGGFLSGGVDSAAVVAEMASSTAEPVRTFSVGFDEQSFDETSAAAATAEIIGTTHRQLNTNLDLSRTLDHFIDLCDDPFADSSSLAVYHLCGAAAKEVTVALSGDGADELLAGYPTYSATSLAATYRMLPDWSRGLVRSAVASMPASDRRYNLQQFASRFVLGAEEKEGGTSVPGGFTFANPTSGAFCKPEFIRDVDDPLELYASRYRNAPDATTRLKRMLHADLAFYLPNDMLAKVDRMSMAHGLEVRVPFMDHEFVEFCTSLPGRHLAHLPFPRQNKLILRRHLRRKLGADVSRRRKKGFNIPIESAMRTLFKSRLHDAISSNRFQCDGPFHVESLRRFAQEHADRTIDAGHALFSALVLAEWWNHWF